MEQSEFHRQITMKWWNELSEGEKSHLLFKHHESITEGLKRDTKSLTDREIDLLHFINKVK